MVSVRKLKDTINKLSKRERRILIYMGFWALYTTISGCLHFVTSTWEFDAVNKMYTAVSLIGLVAIFAFVFGIANMIQYVFNQEQSLRRTVKICTTAAILMIAGAIMQPRTVGALYDTVDTSQVPQQDVVYVTYSTTCEFCIISEDTTIAAVDRYIIATGQKIQLVDIDKDNRLANELRTVVKGKGSVVKLHGNNVTTVVYTQGDGKGNPVKAPTEMIYRYIREVAGSEQ